MRSFGIVLAILLIAMAGCGTDDPSTNDRTNNGAVDAGSDANLDASDNSSTPNNGGNATTPDGGTDSGTDAGPADMGGEDDMGMADAGTDAATDAGTDSGMTSDDAGMDASVDMGMPTYDTCEGAIDATAGGSFTGTTIGETDDYGPFNASNGCPAGGLASGPDVVYSLAPTADTTYDIVLTPDNATYDPMLYILTDCDNDSVCADGTVLNGPGVQESLIGFQANANTTYYIIVDGQNLTSGPFTLDVTIP